MERCMECGMEKRINEDCPSRHCTSLRDEEKMHYVYHTDETNTFTGRTPCSCNKTENHWE